MPALPTRRFAILLDWWRYVTGHYIQRRTVTQAFQEFLSSPDLAEKMRDSATWKRWGLTRVVFRLDGESVPVSGGKQRGPRPRWHPDAVVSS